MIFITNVIKKISEKIEYYVNPFDVVGMLNREHTITKLPENSIMNNYTY